MENTYLIGQWVAAQTCYLYEILVQNTSVWQGWPSLCGSFVEIWKLYPWRENEAGFIFSPQAIVAGIILSNVLPYLEAVYTLPSLWRQNQYDCVSGDALGRLGRMEGKPSEREENKRKWSAWTHHLMRLCCCSKNGSQGYLVHRNTETPFQLYEVG